MTIHHATAAKATKLEIALVEIEGGLVEATHAATNRRVEHTDAKAALALCLLASRFGTEWTCDVAATGSIGTVRSEIDGTSLVEFDVSKFDVDAVFAEALEAAAEAGLDIATEEKPSGTVVPLRYKKLYAERGDASHCGDFLALFCKGRFDSSDGDRKFFNHERFADFLVANGVELTGKWSKLPTSGSKGWEGRYRMNGRLKLEKAVVLSGIIRWEDDELPIPTADLKILRSKHRAFVEAAETAAAEAE